MPVVGRGRGKFTSAKGKLFGGSIGSLTTRETPSNNSNGNGFASNANGASNTNTATTDVWGNVHQDTGNTDRFADPNKEVEIKFNVLNSNLARIIGKGGSNIQNIGAESSANIDIEKRDSDGIITPVIIKGSQLNCDHAKKLIDEICSKFNGFADGQSSSAAASNGGGGGGGGFGSGFGGMTGGGGGGGDDGPSSEEDIWIPEDKCGRVIGRGGSKIQEIQEDSGANVKVHGRETAEDGKVMVTLTGSDGQRSKAKTIIEGLTADRGGGGGGGSNFVTLPSDAAPLDMWVESCRIGRVVGKGGCKIREIQEMFCVRVDIQKDQIKEDDTMVVLTGSPDSTAQAKEYIDELCERSSKPDMSGFDTGGGAGGGDDWGQPAQTNDSGWGAQTTNANGASDSGGWGAVSGEAAW